MISVSSMSLLVPPLRLMSALMWEVVRQRNVRQYGRVVEFVYLVTEAIPDIWTERQTQLLILALRAKVRGDGTDCWRLSSTLCGYNVDFRYWIIHFKFRYLGYSGEVAFGAGRRSQQC